MKAHLTKIVATIGPSCESEEQIAKLILLGVNIFRFNLKHNSLEWHKAGIEKVNRVAKKLGVNVGTLIDLQGPEIRVNMSVPEMGVKQDQLIPMTGGEFSISHPQIIPHLKEGQRVLADDGSFVFEVVHKNKEVFLHSFTTGVLKNRKNFNIPGADFPVPSLVERDFNALKMVSEVGVDFIALSFVRTVDDITTLKKELQRLKFSSKIIAKIETKKSLDNLKEIVEVVDGIMVARGDLGVEISLEKVPYYQKQMIRMAFQKGIPVITATQMLQSMVVNPSPTRAEVSDVANAFYDMTDAVMLSAESASGSYPEETVKMMVDILSFNEKQNFLPSGKPFQFEIKDKPGLICEQAYNLYLSYKKIKDNLAGFLVFTQSGKTATLISRYRPLLPIYVFTQDKKIANSLTIDFGVTTFLHKVTREDEVTKQDLLEVANLLLKDKLIKKGQALIVLHGDHWAVSGGTSTLKIIEV